MELQVKSPPKTLSHLPERPQITIEFQDLTYSVPQGRKASKVILRSLNGTFPAGNLTAILGPSGAGKSTLLNILAGYKSREATGSITINGEPRNIRQFRKLSRYIMQEDLLQPLLTVQECMLIAADLKLSRELSHMKKLTAISEVLDMLRLSNAKDTTTDRLSGGERKRLSIALELVNNPPVIFLDEPTTGLDDVSSSQCVSLLKLLAEGGRTVICSIHSPSARLFAMFDHVYIVATGQCVYQGIGSDIVPFLDQIGLTCPTHYNPADFIIDVASGEYGDYMDKMVSATENGRLFQRHKSPKITESVLIQPSVSNQNAITYLPTPRNNQMKNIPKYDSSGWTQFKILFYRMYLQTFRNTKYLVLRFCLYMFLSLIVSVLFFGMGNDGSKTLFNFGFCFTCVIVFMYCPLLPVLLNFPTEVQIIKREYFNRWYNLPSYFLAMTLINMPIQILLATMYIGVVYTVTNQPLELQRVVMFLTVCVMIGLISESIGLAISSTLNIINGMFVGPVLTVPLMLLSVYGLGSQYENIPSIIRLAMSFSYLRYGMEGLIVAVYGGDRTKLPCPEHEEYCLYVSPKHLMTDMGMEHVVFWFDILMLAVMYVLMKATSFYLLRQRLSPNKTFAALHVIGRIVKSQFGTSR
ncbi:uncharacterized protein CBL_10447 [Carabus blaptoides fortunei]